MALPDPSSVVQELPRRLRPSLAPLRKVPFGIACGVTASLLLGTATLVLTVRGGEHVGDAIGRLGQVLRGYDVTALGTVLGYVYGFVGGFVAGVCVAWFRNVLLAIHLLVVAARERARASSGVLDDLS